MAVDQDWIDDACGIDLDAEFDDAQLNCQQMANGHCMAAGSEYCDLKCPFRDAADAKLSKRQPLPLFPELH